MNATAKQKQPPPTPEVPITDGLVVIRHDYKRTHTSVVFNVSQPIGQREADVRSKGSIDTWYGARYGNGGDVWARCPLAAAVGALERAE